MAFQLFSKEMQKIVGNRFASPTAAQEAGIPPILEGKNVLIIAPTGIGKTESALLPVWDLWLRKREEYKPISILYITPLRALNRNLLDRVLRWSEELDMEVSVRHGDTSQYERSKQMQNPPDMLITTPETLQAVLPSPKMGKHFENVRFVIVDEVHELADNKRGVQLALALERLREVTRKRAQSDALRNPSAKREANAGDFQIIALSATVGSPEAVASFIGGGRKMNIVSAIAKKKTELIVESPLPKLEDRALSEKLYLSADITARLRLIKDTIEAHRSALVFTNTRDFAEILSSRLRTLEKKFAHDIHHSSLSREVRVKAEEQFKSEELKALICTSSLELGIDIGAIDIVIQYNSPRQVSKLLQRIGRSGHSIGRISKGLLIAGDPDDIFESTVIAKHALEGKLEKIEPHVMAWDALANQLVGIVMDSYPEISIDKALEIVKRCHSYKDLEKDQFVRFVNEMHKMRLVWVENDKIKRRRTTREYYYDNLSMIPDTRQYRVINAIDDSPVGVLDEEFVAIHGEPGTTFIVKGRPWKIVGVRNGVIYVEPVEDISAAIPGWEGELIPVPYEISQDVGIMRRRISDLLKKMKEKDVADEITKEYPINFEAALRAVEYIKNQKEFFLPDEKTLVFEKHQDVLIVHSCFGSLINETIGRVLTTLLSAYYGSVSLRVDPYRIIIQMPELGEEIHKILKTVKPNEVEQIVRAALDRSELFKWKFLQVAKKFGAIRKDADYSKVNVKRIIKQFEGTLVYEETLRELMHDKMEIEGTKDVLRRIQNGEIKVKFEKGLSPIGAAGAKLQSREVVHGEKPEREIFDIFKDRLLTTELKLICINCGAMSPTRRVKDFDEEPECEKCMSRLLACVRPHNAQLQKIVKKKIEKKAIAMDEEKAFERLKRSADLVIVYGRKGMVALAGRGVGPETAARVLAKMREKDDDFYKDILNAERTYNRTRAFWS